VFNRCYGSAVSQKEIYTGISGSGYIITLRNNIITNSKEYLGKWKGYGVLNLLENTHSFMLQNNCFYNNPGGDCKGTRVSASDIQVDPKYANEAKNDYHLKSKAGRWNEKNG